jgi:hypothetical protein
VLRIHAVPEGDGFAIRVWLIPHVFRWDLRVELGKSPFPDVASIWKFIPGTPLWDEVQAACGIHLFGLPPRSAARRACERRWSDGHGRCYATPRMDLERGGWVMDGDEGEDFGLIDLSEMTATRPGEDRTRPCTTSPPP